MSRLDRTTVAIVLTVAAVVLPCAAWYVSGWRAARHRASGVVEAVRADVQRDAERHAERLAVRLESLRDSESRRPVTDYERDPRVFGPECELDLAGPSPLAAGPDDPLVWAHFQLDELGQIALPTLPGHDSVEAEQIQRAILEELECATPGHLLASPHDEELEARRRFAAPGGVVTVGPFRWHTVRVSDDPALVALREVGTPRAVLNQGFVILSSALERELAGSGPAVRVRPGPAAADGESPIALDGDPWAVSLDPTARLETAAAEGARVLARFRLTFLLGMLGACIAGTAVVLLVRQTERLARERASFAASAAHELRTPLTGLRLYGEMLADGSGDEERRAEYARRIADEADRLGRVVSNVLGFANLERGGNTLRTVPGDLAAAVRESVERLRPALEMQGARPVVTVDRDVQHAHFDRDALHQILQNLLDNAEKYSRGARDRSIEVRVMSGARGPVVSVTDHGPGVAGSLRRRLFRPFLRNPDPEAPAGLGIGLALVSAMARAQNAAVRHADAPGGGSTFSVEFLPGDG
ncbi:MAG: HAMP domain-containing histidine kinase [bacterium]|nr:HAMP domain-containing histidine kinase [bacterium]